MTTAISRSGHWVLVPGTLCTPDVFSPMLAQLKVPVEKRRYVAADAPFVGDYDAPLRAAVQDGDIVCGFSLGSLILAHNLDAISKAKAVVLLSVNPLPDREGNRANREAMRDQVLAGGARDWILDNWEAMSTDRGKDIKTFVADMAVRTTDLISAQTELAASRPGAEHALRHTNLPAVYVTGSEDKLTPPIQVESIASDNAFAAVSILEGLGHFALLEAPDRVAQAVATGLGEALCARQVGNK